MDNVILLQLKNKHENISYYIRRKYIIFWIINYNHVIFIVDEGKTAVTKAGSLTNKYIIHAVGPVWIDVLYLCYRIES